MIKICKVELDPITEKLAQAFDYSFSGESSFEIPSFKKPEEFNIGLVVGNSGTGKSLILKEFFNIRTEPVWNPNLSIAGHFFSLDEATSKLFAVGLSSIPTLCKPYHVLSNGEAYRAKISRMLLSDTAIDEFTSVVNRETAYGICVSISKYIRKNNLKNIVFASCHFDIVDWLEPDWVFNTNTKDFITNSISLDKFPKLGEFEIS